MYEPYYKCRGLACDKRVRVEGSFCQMCYDAFGWMDAYSRQVAHWLSVGNSLYAPTEFAVTEREAVSLMKEYAA
jgi:hypothetical protein